MIKKDRIRAFINNLHFLRRRYYHFKYVDPSNRKLNYIVFLQRENFKMYKNLTE